MTKDQRKAVLAMFVAGATPEAIAEALKLPLGEVQAAAPRGASPVAAPVAAPRAKLKAPLSPTAELDLQIAALQVVPPGETEAQRAERRRRFAEVEAARARLLRDLREERERSARQLPGVVIHGSGCATIRDTGRVLGAGVRGDKRTI